MRTLLAAACLITPIFGQERLAPLRTVDSVRRDMDEFVLRLPDPKLFATDELPLHGVFAAPAGIDDIRGYSVHDWQREPAMPMFQFEQLLEDLNLRVGPALLPLYFRPADSTERSCSILALSAEHGLLRYRGSIRRLDQDRTLERIPTFERVDLEHQKRRVQVDIRGANPAWFEASMTFALPNGEQVNIALRDGEELLLPRRLNPVLSELHGPEGGTLFMLRKAPDLSMTDTGIHLRATIVGTYGRVLVKGMGERGDLYCARSGPLRKMDLDRPSFRAPGAYRFVLRDGDRELGTWTAEVRANETTIVDLSVPPKTR